MIPTPLKNIIGTLRLYRTVRQPTLLTFYSGRSCHWCRGCVLERHIEPEGVFYRRSLTNQNGTPPSLETLVHRVGFGVYKVPEDTVSESTGSQGRYRVTVLSVSGGSRFPFPVSGVENYPPSSLLSLGTKFSVVLRLDRSHQSLLRLLHCKLFADPFHSLSFVSHGSSLLSFSSRVSTLPPSVYGPLRLGILFTTSEIPDTLGSTPVSCTGLSRGLPSAQTHLPTADY